ncbi:hypothetical protein OC834_005176 [Tilletia horrida]|nr:hypothetical protein OC834_005176 [Tilletia horrida]
MQGDILPSLDEIKVLPQRSDTKKPLLAQDVASTTIIFGGIATPGTVPSPQIKMQVNAKRHIKTVKLSPSLEKLAIDRLTRNPTVPIPIKYVNMETLYLHEDDAKQRINELAAAVARREIPAYIVNNGTHLSVHKRTGPALSRDDPSMSALSFLLQHALLIVPSPFLHTLAVAFVMPRKLLEILVLFTGNKTHQYCFHQLLLLMGEGEGGWSAEEKAALIKKQAKTPSNTIKQAFDFIAKAWQSTQGQGSPDLNLN